MTHEDVEIVLRLVGPPETREHTHAEAPRVDRIRRARHLLDRHGNVRRELGQAILRREPRRLVKGECHRGGRILGPFGDGRRLGAESLGFGEAPFHDRARRP